MSLRYLIAIILLQLLQIGKAQEFNIQDYGAIGDGEVLNTEAIQATIDAAHKEGGRVIVPSGKFLCGSIELKSNVELHLEKNATILGSTQFEDFRKGTKHYMRALILSSFHSNISITGEGVIDGQGTQAALNVDSLFYEGLLDSNRYNKVENRPRFYMRPSLILMRSCDSIKVQGVTLKNAASWVQNYDRCTNLTINNIIVDSDAYWNNDGMDISDCKHVRITNCFVNAADDGICLKSHYRDHFVEDVYVSNCVVRSSASAIKFGTKSLGGFKNVKIENISIYDTYRSALAIESVDGGFLEDIYISDIDAINTGNAIFIRLGDREHEDKISTLRNVTIKNLKVDVAFRRPDYNYELRGPSVPSFHNIIPSSITGLPDNYVENVKLENIEINYPGRGHKGYAYASINRLHAIPEHPSEYPEFSMFGELPAWGFFIRHVDGLEIKNVKLSIDAPDYRYAIVCDDVKNLSLIDAEINGDAKLENMVVKNVENIKVDSTIKIIDKTVDNK